MRFQAEKAMKDLDRIIRHLHDIDDMSEGESEYVNEHLPNLVTAAEMFKTIFKVFRVGL